MREAVRSALQHAGRAAFAPAVAVLAWLAFPQALGNLPPPLEVGAVAPEDIIAARGFVVTKTEAERAREAEDLAASVKAVVRTNPAAADSAEGAAAHFFAALDSAAALGVPLGAAARAAGVALDTAELRQIERAGGRSRVRRAVAAALRVSREGYLAPGVSSADLGREVVVRSADGERIVPAESLASFSDFLDRTSGVVPGLGSVGEERLFIRLVGAFFQPTIVFERAETEGRRDALRRSVDTVLAVVRSGEKIIGAHEVVDAEDARKIDALRTTLLGGVHGRVATVLSAFGGIWMNALILAVFGVFCAFHRRHLYRSVRVLAVFAAGFAVTLAGAGLVARAAPGHPELIPVAFAAMLFTMLFDSRVALLAAAVIAVLVGIAPSFTGTHAIGVVFVGGAAAALSLQTIRRRVQVYLSIGVLSAVYAGAALVEGLAAGAPLAAIGTTALYGAGNAVFSAMLATLVLPMAESYTHCTTDLTLLELADPSRPLLRRLATEAPGTYAHSVAMANLCEAACNAIGANGLLARVGCYYHDIGKLVRPLYFVENLGHAKNPHDHLKPSQSASVIRRHVEDGLKLAAEHGLPEPVRAFIPEHHGTAPITFFLEKARDVEPEALDREAAFRYPGPFPRSAETAVALLADSVEAALRVLDEPTPETVQAAIEHLVDARVESGLLREAPLTLRQLEIVKQEFVRVLSAMDHDRLDYPEDAGGISADWEDETHA
jgi:putative nucleotidyltransferase with HDIG domain